MNDENEQHLPAANAGKKPQKGRASTREDRLKAALKANMGRRKAQAKARRGDTKENEQGQ